MTGSKIRQSPLEQNAPVTTLTEEDLRRSGANSIADILQRMPTSGGALNTKFNSSGNFGFPPDGGGIGAGAAQVDLRNLGSNRVLVLVDGVRWVNGSSASGVSSATDLNTIPTSIIERVEVLEDGASAIYGSDAIAGVVNIITKKDYDGFGLSAHSGVTSEGDGQTQEYNLSWGVSGDDTNMFFNLAFNDQEEIYASDRDIASYPIPGVEDCAAGCSAGTPQGGFFGIIDPNTGRELNLTTNDGVSGIPVYDPANPGGPNDDFHAFTNADRFNFAQYNLVQAPLKRWSAFSQISQELNDSVTMRFKALYNNRQSRNQAAPEPLFIGPDAGNGNLMDTIAIDVSNPYNPFGFTIDPDTSPAYAITRRPLEGGPRVFRQDVDTFYVSGGFEGDFVLGERTFYWDTTLAYSRNHATQIKTGGYNSRHLQLALGPVDECAAIPGCVPFNIFGGQGANGEGTITQEMLDWVGFIQKDESEQQLKDFTANLSGSLFELPAGPLGFAMGFEYRDQEGYFQPDAVVVAGESAGVPSSPTSGSYDSNEFFVEFDVPLLADMTMARELNLSLAGRSQDYSTFGSEVTGKYGLRWRPVDDVMVRYSFAEGLRAPGIGELFGSQARFDQTLEDPCSGLDGDTDPTIVESCVALGVPGDGSYTQLNPQISVTTGGNSELEPETSESVVWGIVYSPSWVDSVDWIGGLDLELNHFDIEVEGAIQALNASTQLNACVQTLDPVLCSGISRTGSGAINGFSNQLTNIGGIETSGYDFRITYETPETSVGTFRVQWANSFLSEYTEIFPSADGFLEVEREGTEIGDPERGFPEWKFNVNLDWHHRDWAATWTLRYIDELTESCEAVEGLGLCSDEAALENKLDATVYNDVQLTWSPVNTSNRYAVTLGINNLFDEEPPECYSCALNGFDATNYDAPGQFVYLRLGLNSN
ncbi:TonB-dependent receptor domain-containing protein [Microbulbifer sp.]|uniref:TonB-dependent receptor domain-containing protein n=1 Tax=Microbulbifer sp. TaxID=1908541 RepID=UPI003F356AA3